MMEQKVSEIMTRDVITTTPETDVVYAFEKLMQYKISSLPVVDGEKIIGIITATDVGHNLILDKYELGTKVEEIMVKDVVTISPDDTLKTAIDVMKEAIPGSGILNQIPIVEDGKLVGIISDGDIIQEVI